jgi:hypothetical protein
MPRFPMEQSMSASLRPTGVRGSVARVTDEQASFWHERKVSVCRVWSMYATAQPSYVQRRRRNGMPYTGRSSSTWTVFSSQVALVQWTK